MVSYNIQPNGGAITSSLTCNVVGSTPTTGVVAGDMPNNQYWFNGAYLINPKNNDQYTFGGRYNGTRTDDIYKRSGDGVWSLLSESCPGDDEECQGVYYNGKFYIHRGDAFGENLGSTQVYEFDPATDTITNANFATLSLFRRSCGTAVTSRGYMVLCGGASTAFPFSTDVQVVDLNTGNVRTYDGLLSVVTSPRDACTVIGDTVYVCTGASNVETLDFSGVTDISTQTPSLGSSANTPTSRDSAFLVAVGNNLVFGRPSQGGWGDNLAIWDGSTWTSYNNSVLLGLFNSSSSGSVAQVFDCNTVYLCGSNNAADTDVVKLTVGANA